MCRIFVVKLLNLRVNLKGFQWWVLSIECQWWHWQVVDMSWIGDMSRHINNIVVLLLESVSLWCKYAVHMMLLCALWIVMMSVVIILTSIYVGTRTWHSGWCSMVPLSVVIVLLLIIQSLLDVNISSVRSVTHLQSGLHTSHSTCELLGCNNRSMLVTAAVYMVGSLDL